LLGGVATHQWIATHKLETITCMCEWIHAVQNSNRERTREGKRVESREPRDKYKLYTGHVHWHGRMRPNPQNTKSTLCEKSSWLIQYQILEISLINFDGFLSFTLSFFFPERLHCCYIDFHCFISYWLSAFHTEI